MGSKQRRVIIMFPRHTLETTIFHPVEREIRRLYTEGFYPSPTPVQHHHLPLTPGDFLPLPNEGNVPSVVDEDHLRRLYATAVSLMPERRGLTWDQMLSVTA
jgi:hypothetical protein